MPTPFEISCKGTAFFSYTIHRFSGLCCIYDILTPITCDFYSWPGKSVFKVCLPRRDCLRDLELRFVTKGERARGATDVAVTNNRYIATLLHRYIRCILMYCQKSAENETIE